MVACSFILDIGSMAGCVFGYFADCTVVMPLFLLIAILRNVGVGMLRFGWRAWASHSQAASPWLRSPHFIMFSGYQLTKVCQQIRSHFINKQRHPFWPFSSLTWCCALLLHKYLSRCITLATVQHCRKCILWLYSDSKKHDAC